jgi:hypothetical protein
MKIVYFINFKNESNLEALCLTIKWKVGRKICLNLISKIHTSTH